MAKTHAKSRPRFEVDEHLRRFGFTIWERKNGAEPVWKNKDGVEYSQSEAIHSADEMLLALETK